MTQTATPNYAAMSKADLIGVIETQKLVIQRFKRIIPLPNTVIAPGEKLALSAAIPLIAQEKPDETGLVRIPIDKIAERTGMSESSISRYVANLADRFNARKECIPYTTKKGQKCHLTYIDPSEPVWSAPWEAELPEEKERTINGNGKYCDRCKTFNLKVTTRRLTYQEVQECECCGYRKVSAILADTDNEPLQPGEYIPEKKGPQAEDLFSEETAATPTDMPVAEKLENLPLLTAQVPPSIADAESLAAELLVEMAGNAQQHIEMCKAGNPKYVTVRRQPTVEDMIDHLRGRKTKGALLSHPFDWTRVSCYEADTPEDFQRLRASAVLLADVGYHPLLEPSPTIGKHKGGGALWVIYERLVDIYSAHQTILHHAPDLAICKEYWPNGSTRRRLPGGKYVEPGNVAWCKLEDANGNELSHDGAGAALVLLQHQTPAALVNAYTKPAPVLDLQSERSDRKPSAQAGYLEKNVAKQIVADFNASHSWDEIAALCGGFNRRGKFLATWRGDRKPDVGIWHKTDLAKDFARNEPAMDKYEVWCRIQAGVNGNWEAVKKRDLAERCQQKRDQERKAS